MWSEWKEDSFRTHSSTNGHPLCAELCPKWQEHRSECERWSLTCRLGPWEDLGPRCSPVQVGQSVDRELVRGGGAGRVGCEAQGAGGLAPSSECLSEIPREEEEGFMGAEPSRQ